MVKHWMNVHGGLGTPSYSVKVLGTHKTAAERQVREAILIEHYRLD